MDEDQAKVICEELFEYYYHAQPPQSTADYYVQQLVSGSMGPDDIQQQIRTAIEASLPKSQPQPQPQLQSPARSPPAAPPATTSFTLPSVPGSKPPTPSSPTATGGGGGGGGTGKWSRERVTEYVDALCEKYCGGVTKADIALRSQTISSIMSGGYTLANAEWAIQMSPEAKKHATQSKSDKLREYIQELAKKYTPGRPVERAEEDRFVAEVNRKQISLQDLEDEFKLRALQGTSAPKTAPRRK